MNLSKALVSSIALFGMLSLIGCGSDSVMSVDQSTTEAKLIIWDPVPAQDSLSLPLKSDPIIYRFDPETVDGEPVKSDIITISETVELKNPDEVIREEATEKQRIEE